jgi:hypothetical protein
MQHQHEAPSIKTIGSVQDVTQRKPNKCGGSSDLFLPNLLGPLVHHPCKGDP